MNHLDQREFEHACKLAKRDPATVANPDSYLRGWRQVGLRHATKRTTHRASKKTDAFASLME